MNDANLPPEIKQTDSILPEDPGGSFSRSFVEPLRAAQKDEAYCVALIDDIQRHIDGLQRQKEDLVARRKTAIHQATSCEAPILDTGRDYIGSRIGALSKDAPAYFDAVASRLRLVREDSIPKIDTKKATVFGFDILDEKSEMRGDLGLNHEGAGTLMSTLRVLQDMNPIIGATDSGFGVLQCRLEGDESPDKLVFCIFIAHALLGQQRLNDDLEPPSSRSEARAREATLRIGDDGEGDGQDMLKALADIRSSVAGVENPAVVSPAQGPKLPHGAGTMEQIDIALGKGQGEKPVR